MHLVPSLVRRSLRKLMGVDRPLKTVSAVASATYRQRPTDNEDAVGTAECPAHGLRAVVIADGLGSQEHAGLGAQWSVETVTHLIESATRWSAPDMRHLFVQARQRLRERAEVYCAQENLVCDWEQSFGTTLIVAVEDEHSLWLGYVGNGAIWHVRGGFNEFSENQYLPWNALNYLNPHTLQNEHGKEALYRLISTAEDDDAEPTILQIQKDTVHGDLLMICTDGIHSNDQVNVGRTKDSTIWLKMEQPLLRFFEALKELFSRNDPETVTDQRLRAALERYLERLCADGLLDDDSSLGVIITSTALHYQAHRTKR